VVAELLFPDVERRLAPVDSRQREIDPDEARCVCELRVAPSRPLRFLTVRLERQADGVLTAEAS